MAPEDTVSKTVQHTTQHYLNVDCENCSNMQEHYQSRFPGLRLPHQKEGVATDTYFPSVKTSRGHTCSQMFVGLTSDRWYTQTHSKLNPTMGKLSRTTLAKSAYPLLLNRTMPKVRQVLHGLITAVTSALALKPLNQVTLGRILANTESELWPTW